MPLILNYYLDLDTYVADDERKIKKIETLIFDFKTIFSRQPGKIFYHS